MEEIGKIHYFTPSPNDNDLGSDYNYYMSLLPNDNDWACFTDRDAFFIQNNYITKIEKAVKDNSDAGLITCITNRVGERKQCYKERIDDNPNILAHYAIGKKLENIYTYTEIPHEISGFCMMVKKSVWQNVKFPAGLLGVDNEYSRMIIDAGYRIIRMDGLYMFHYYRLKQGRNNKEHLK